MYDTSKLGSSCSSKVSGRDFEARGRSRSWASSTRAVKRSRLILEWTTDTSAGIESQYPSIRLLYHVTIEEPYSSPSASSQTRHRLRELLCKYSGHADHERTAGPQCQGLGGFRNVVARFWNVDGEVVLLVDLLGQVFRA